MIIGVLAYLPQFYVAQSKAYYESCLKPYCDGTICERGIDYLGEPNNPCGLNPLILSGIIVVFLILILWGTVIWVGLSNLGRNWIGLGSDSDRENGTWGKQSYDDEGPLDIDFDDEEEGGEADQ